MNKVRAYSESCGFEPEERQQAGGLTLDPAHDVGGQFCHALRSVQHPRRRVDADPLAGRLRHDECDATPVRGSPACVSCPVGQDHVTLASAGLAVGFGALVAEGRRLRVGLRQPAGVLAALEPL